MIDGRWDYLSQLREHQRCRVCSPGARVHRASEGIDEETCQTSSVLFRRAHQERTGTDGRLLLHWEMMQVRRTASLLPPSTNSIFFKQLDPAGATFRRSNFSKAFSQCGCSQLYSVFYRPLNTSLPLSRCLRVICFSRL